MTASSPQALGGPGERRGAGDGTLKRDSSGDQVRAGLIPTLVLTVALAAAAFLLATSLLLLVVHPSVTPQLRAFATIVNQQNQNAKTALYLAGFVGFPLLALITVPRVADRIAAGSGGAATSVLAGAIAASLAATIVLARLSSLLPWGDGLPVVLALVGLWALLACAALARAARGPWPSLLRVADASAKVWAISGVLVFGAILCVSDLRTLRVVPLLLGGGAFLAVLAGHGRLAFPRIGRLTGRGIDLLVVVVILLAVPDMVIFQTSSTIPNAFFPPGIIQFQHDWIVGPANQLRAGGALLVNSPVSQYGVGMLYLLAAWFHLVPIGYGTFGLLDGILTALFYASGYLVLRFAGASRILAGGALALGVVALVYNLHYPVGGLPEQGPLRFGLGMLVIVGSVAAARWPRRAPLGRALTLLVLGIASIWALENFAYAAVTFVAMTAAEAALAPAGSRRRCLVSQLSMGAAACVCAHLMFAAATLAGSGQLPHWGQYLAYLHALLLGGREGSITYGFERWSPGLGMAAFCMASAVGIILLLVRAPAVAARERLSVIALAGTTSYSIAVFSYTDNRSSTYLLLYVALPVLLTAVLWLSLLMRNVGLVPRAARIGSLALSLGVAVLMIAAAWSSVGQRFERSALAHAYPGGGLRAALHRLWHPPAIDPRAPEGARLVALYFPGDRASVVLPTASDLSIEILMRSGRANRFFIGDPVMDSFIPSVWMPKIERQLQQLRTGDRLLTDASGEAIAATLASNPSIDPIKHPILDGASQGEWILRSIYERFQLRPIAGSRDGLVVVELVSRKR